MLGLGNFSANVSVLLRLELVLPACVIGQDGIRPVAE
jgi:hypothetical protein